jgi:hypothetical protein
MSQKAKAFASGFHPVAQATGFSTYALINAKIAVWINPWGILDSL